MPNLNLFGFNFFTPNFYTTSIYVEDGMTFINEYPVYTKTNTLSMTTSTYSNDRVTISNEFPIIPETYIPSIAITTLTDSDGTFVLENWNGESWSTTVNSEGETIINNRGIHKSILWGDFFNGWVSTEEIHTTLSEHEHHSKNHEDIDFNNFWGLKRDQAVSTITLASTSSSPLSFSYPQETGSNLVERDFHTATSSVSDEVDQAAAEASAAASAAKLDYINGQTITMPAWAIAITVIGSIGLLLLGGVLLLLIARKRSNNRAADTGSATDEYCYPSQPIVVENPFAQSSIIVTDGDVPSPAYHSGNTGKVPHYLSDEKH